MAVYGNSSKRRLATVTDRLQEVFNDVIQVVDNSVLVGHRSEADQNAAYAKGASTLKWPESKHNSQPSRAVDAAPYPIDWAPLPSQEELKHWDRSDLLKWAKQYSRFHYLAGVVLGVGFAKGVRIRWGGDWDQDDDFSDQKFDDLVHFEELEDV